MSSGQLTRFDGNRSDWVTSDEVPDPNPLPQVTGWNLLIRPVPIDTSIAVKGSTQKILLPSSFTEDVKFLTNVGKIKAMGPSCYQDPNVKPSDGPYYPYGRYKNKWCNVGDYVVWGKHQGVKLLIKGVAFILLQDELVLLTLKDPGDVNPMLNAFART